jgi:6,7-dimethyl-8-ribityllumazine synthase
MTTYAGTGTAPAGRFAIVAARFNVLVVQHLVDGALETLRHHGVANEDVDLVWVPGSFEIPVTAKRLASGGRYAAIITLGAVIRGETDHYEHVAGIAARGIARVSLDTGVPTIFGVLTCDTLEQALNRAGAKSGNKGADAALAALQMAGLMKQLP